MNNKELEEKLTPDVLDKYLSVCKNENIFMSVIQSSRLRTWNYWEVEFNQDFKDSGDIYCWVKKVPVYIDDKLDSREIKIVGDGCSVTVCFNYPK